MKLKQLEKKQRKPRNRAQKSSLMKGAATNDGSCEGTKESRDDTNSDDDQ